MIKGIVLAALLGYASTTYSGWIETDNLVDNEWLNVNYLANLDAGYGTHWERIPGQEDGSAFT